MTTPLDWILLFIVFAVVVVIGYRILMVQWSEEERLGEDETEEYRVSKQETEQYRE